MDAAAQGNIHVRLLASLSIVNHGSKLNGSRCIIISVELQRSIGVENHETRLARPLTTPPLPSAEITLRATFVQPRGNWSPCMGYRA